MTAIAHPHPTNTPPAAPAAAPAGCVPMALPGRLRPSVRVWARVRRTSRGQLVADVFWPDGRPLLQAVQNSSTRRWSDFQRSTRPIRTLPDLVETVLWQQELCADQRP